jgi:hypothetical protein
MGVRFVDIGGFVNNHCLNCLFLILDKYNMGNTQSLV